MEEQLKRINNKLQQLVQGYLFLKKENERKTDEIKLLKETTEVKSKRIEELQQQVLILKSAVGEIKEADKKEFEKHINQYIKEINKSIGLLSE